MLKLLCQRLQRKMFSEVDEQIVTHPFLPYNEGY